MEIKQILLSDLAVNDYNPNEVEGDKLLQLKKVIKNTGYGQFIIVRPMKERQGKYLIIDGEHRWLAMKDEPEFQAPQYCVVVDSEEDAAKVQTINFNSLRGETDSVKVALIIKDLLVKYSAEDLEKKLGLTLEEIDKYEELLKFDMASLPDINLGDVPDIEERKLTIDYYFELTEEEEKIFKEKAGKMPPEEQASEKKIVMKAIKDFLTSKNN